MFFFEEDLKKTCYINVVEPQPAVIHPLIHIATIKLLLAFLSGLIFPVGYPGPRGFRLFFTAKFCYANRFYYFCYRHEAVRALKASGRDR